MKKLYLIFLISISLSIFSCLENENPNLLLDQQVLKIDAYISANHASDFVFYDQSGIRFVVKEFGDLPPAKTGQAITVDLIGKVFETEIEFKNTLLNTKLESISEQGLRYVLSNVMVGSKIIAFIPSAYAYGETGNGIVPANSIVVFDFELISSTPTTAQLEQLKVDTLAIRNHLTINAIENVTRHPSGIYYKLNNLGTGSLPHVYDQISLSYEGKLLSNGNVFDSGRLTSMLFNLIDGFKVVVPKLREGGQANLFIPSLYGYGTTPTSGIPANSVLIFNITLETVAN